MMVRPHVFPAARAAHWRLPELESCQLITGEDGGIVQLWQTQPPQPSTVIGHHSARIKSVAFSPDRKQVVSAGDDNVITLWDVSSRKLITRIRSTGARA